MKVADQIFTFVKRLHPAQRRAIKAALRALETGAATDILPLSDELEGFYRLRVGKFRIIFRYMDNREISCEFIDARDTVYEQFVSLREFIEKR
jgi:mRNA interferase RelE/StbE